MSSANLIEIATPEVLKKYGLLTPDGLDKFVEQDKHSHSLVEGFIEAPSVSVLIGDSGLGKSPLAYQLGLCVAAGVAFFGMEVRQGAVVYVDYENGARNGRNLAKSLAGFLDLPDVPENFITWHLDSAKPFDLEGVVRDVHPGLVIVDSLRSHNPTFEQTDNAGKGMKQLRSIAYSHGTSVLVIHHVKKPGLFAPNLEEGVFMNWLKQAAGHSSIINQSDTRIGVAVPRRREGLDVEMVMRWHRRTRGEDGLIYLSRVHDEYGEPIGYRPLVGPELLPATQQDAFYKLLDGEFTFKQAMQAYGRSDDPTSKWMARCIALGLVRKVKRGVYRKTWPRG
jgi:hypothetical protein